MIGTYKNSVVEKKEWIPYESWDSLLIAIDSETLSKPDRNVYTT